MTLEDKIDKAAAKSAELIAASVRLAGKGIAAGSKQAGRAINHGWDHSHQAWQYTRPLVYGSLAYLGAQYAFSALDPIIDQHILPVATDFLGGYGSYLTDNISSIAGTILGSYVGIGTALHFWHESKAKLNKAPGFLKKLKGTIGTLLLAPVTAAAMYASTPGFVQDIENRFFASDIPVAIEKAVGGEAAMPHAVTVRDDIKTAKDVTIVRAKADARYLNRLGYNLNSEQLFIMAKVVSGEAGNYFKFKNFAARQKEDMEAIVNVMINRYVAANSDNFCKREFNAGANVNFKSILLKYKQFSIANDPERVALWNKSVEDGRLLSGVKYRSAKNKTLLAYMTLVQTLTDAAINPSDDQTGGATHYKNNLDKEAARKKWDGAPFGKWTQRTYRKIQAHTYYILRDKNGKNPLFDMRKSFFEDGNRAANH